MITIFGEEYEENNLPAIITLPCGCVYNKDNCKIGISYSSNSLCEEHTVVIDLDEEKQKVISELKEKIQLEIYEVYPIWKQMNITNILTGYLEADKTTMISFIESKRTSCDAKEVEIVACTTIEELREILI